MDKNNLISFGNFVWWIGVIEDRDDLLRMGRCRVRIFGWHTDNTNLLPTTDLPWAQPIQPMSGSSSFSTARVGDWVLGFFMDGDDGQFPMMLGLVPGLKQNTQNSSGVSPTGGSKNLSSSTTLV